MRALSGGERNRLLLAKLFLKPSNLLILDEPTNDLDVETLELLEELIDGYQGTVMLVSHDRQFVDNTVTECWIFEGNGEIGAFVGGYHDAQLQRAAYKQNRMKAQPAATSAKPATAKDEPAKRAGNKLSYNLQRELEQLPQKWKRWRARWKRYRRKWRTPVSSTSHTMSRSRYWTRWLRRSRSWKWRSSAGNIWSR